MALGDGIRRNIATVSKEERGRLRDAILALNHTFFPGSKTDTPIPGGVSYWFKQDETHDSTHVHGCPAFLPWHREMCNRFEGLIRQIDPELSLHYWDWNTDPSHMPDGDGGFINLFDSDFMGNADGSVNGGEVGDPLLAAGFYNPAAAPNDRDNTTNPADPILSLTRSKRAGPPPVGGTIDGFNWPSDGDLINAATWEAFNDLMIGVELNPSTTNGAHAGGHSYIGGVLSDPHTSFRDPFVFLLHSNVDRLWAMWQRMNPAVRLDPNQVYGTQEDSKGSGDVATLHPNWGILSPLEPWAGPGVQTAVTGIIANVVPIRPWAAPESQQVYKDSRDLSVVIPPSYDTAPHSSYIVTDRDTFSTYELESVLSYPRSFYVIYDGFTPNALGLPGPAPAISFLDSPNGAAIGSISATNPVVTLENSGAPDTPQRVLVAFDISFTDASAFPVPPLDIRHIFLRASFGGLSDLAAIHLINQPNPYMVDGPTSWLSTDVRVFQLRPGGTLPGSSTQLTNPDSTASAPYQYIQSLLTEFRGYGNSPSPFEMISQDEQASELELSRTVSGVRVLNFAVAKVRYRANTQDATDVRLFFRTFNTMVSALDYRTDTNYRRSPDGTIPLLGRIGSEIASVPYFAEARIDSATQDMTAQHDDTNKQPINHAAGQESIQYFGCWLDFNQTEPQFPLHPSADGHFSDRLPLTQLVRGIHQCLVAEIRFQPGASDPIQTGATPASSDRLAQRNLAVVQSDNPGAAATHVVQHTLLVKPSIVSHERPRIAALVKGREAFDELVIRWNDLPRDTIATLFFPEWSADEIVLLASVLRQGPAALKKVDASTIECKVTDITYVPIPGPAVKPYAGLITLQLPQTVRDGQVFKVDVEQHSGIFVDEVFRAGFGKQKSQRPLVSVSARKVLSTFRMTIPVKMGQGLLRREVRNLAVLRYIAQAIPTDDRWYRIFGRYIDKTADKVRGLGIDPDQVQPSADDPGIPGFHPGQKAPFFTGKVCEVKYDCFGDFEGFVLETCSKRHHFSSRESGIAELAWRACRERTVVSVYVEPGRRRKILGIVLECGTRDE